MPYVIVGDEAFPLKSYLMRPYSKNYVTGSESNRIFNYRLSRARRVVENSFGILSARWRVFLRYLEVQPDMVDKIVLASCCLHNMLCTDDFEPSNNYCDGPNSFITSVEPLRQNSSQHAFSVRDKFRNYFLSEEGSVPWQNAMVRRGRNNLEEN